jgi:hypothetical protein
MLSDNVKMGWKRELAAESKRGRNLHVAQMGIQKIVGDVVKLTNCPKISDATRRQRL